MELGLKLLRAEAASGARPLTRSQLWNIFQKNLKSWGMKLNWGLDGCALWRRPAEGPWQGAKEFKLLGSKIELDTNFQMNLNNL